MKLVTVLGARPQFIKAAPVSRALQRHGEIREVVVHTGQHFDRNMSSVFFDQLGLNRPEYDLGISGGSHGRMTGRMLEAVEEVLARERPDGVVVYGDTNSTLAGALAASKLHIPVAHVEAGLRSFDRRMPEELNRVIVDNLSEILFCPTEQAVTNLDNEGFDHRPVTISLVGDVMLDAVGMFGGSAVPPDDWSIGEGFILATIHRAENTDDDSRLREIIGGLNLVNSVVGPVIMPIHPRTKAAIMRSGLTVEFNLIAPVGYLEMLWLLRNSGLVITDSGGLQKEAYMLGRQCVTVRDSTEWTELLNIGANRLVVASADRILVASRSDYGKEVKQQDGLYGGGKAADLIAEILAERILRPIP